MTPPSGLQTLLYVSKLAREIPTADVHFIARRSRVSNRADAITGVMVFDSTHFAQLVEGPSERVSDLLERLRSDPRHVDIDVLAHGPSGPARRYAEWHLGYAEVDDARAAMAVLRRLRGADAIEAFAGLVPKLTAPDGAVPSGVRLERMTRDMNAATDSSRDAVHRSMEALGRRVAAGTSAATSPEGNPAE